MTGLQQLVERRAGRLVGAARIISTGTGTGCGCGCGCGRTPMHITALHTAIGAVPREA